MYYGLARQIGNLLSRFNPYDIIDSISLVLSSRGEWDTVTRQGVKDFAKAKVLAAAGVSAGDRRDTSAISGLEAIGVAEPLVLPDGTSGACKRTIGIDGTLCGSR
jgi:hypothetical protein